MQTTTSTEKEGAATFDSFIPSQSLYFPPPWTIDEISPGDKRGLEQASGKGQVNGVCTASRQKDEEYISIRSLLSNSPRPLALLLFPLHPLSLSWLSRGRNRVEIYPSCPRPSNHRFLFSRERSPRWDGPSQMGGKSNANFFFIVWSIWSGFWICLFTRYNSVRTNVSSFFFSRVIFYFIAVYCILILSTMKGEYDFFRRLMKKIFVVCYELHELISKLFEIVYKLKMSHVIQACLF